MSLIFCQIQSFIIFFWNCLFLPKFSKWQILLAIILPLGFQVVYWNPFFQVSIVLQSSQLFYSKAMHETECSAPVKGVKDIAVFTMSVTSNTRSIHIKVDALRDARKGI
jgi:hypothetical protein